MAQQTIGIGATADDGTGDNLRIGGGKINSNFTELYAFFGGATPTKVPVVDCGDCDLSGGNMPATGGTGSAGAVNKGNFFNVAIGGTVSGFYIEAGSEIRAKVNTPGNTLANWRINGL